MERLTVNKSASEMGIYELAHNCCYAQDGRARYRDYDLDIDARELTRKLLKDYADGDDAFTDDEDFDEQMIDYMQYGMDSIEGLIALFYRNLWTMADLRERLKEYEDLEEQGLLLKLPCKVGDTVYILDRDGKPRKMILDAPDIRCHCAKEDNLCMALCDSKNTGICAYRFKNDGSDIGKNRIPHASRSRGSA